MSQVSNEQLRALQADLGPALLAYFARRIDPPADAAILLNELLVVMWRKARSIPLDEEESRMWTFGIARNLVLTHRRGSARRAALAGRLRDELASRPADIESDTVMAVRKAIADLPEPQRELIVLVHWDGFSLVEAAAITGVSASTARSRYQVARHKLASDLYADALQSCAHSLPTTRTFPIDLT
jgi:RNA polymerase sigma-70 factor (ECF subfamily)